MYTNGYTGWKYLSIIGVRRCDGSPVAALTEQEFAAESEHVTLQSFEFFNVTGAYSHDGAHNDCALFTGWEGAQP